MTIKTQYARCEDCKHYKARTKNGKVYRYGFCALTDKYKQACAIRCKQRFKPKGGDAIVR